MEFKYGDNREEKIDKFLDTLAWHFSTKQMGDATARAVNKLNENLDKATEASTKLTRALNKITLAGVVIAGLGIIISVGHLILEILRYTSDK